MIVQLRTTTGSSARGHIIKRARALWVWGNVGGGGVQLLFVVCSFCFLKSMTFYTVRSFEPCVAAGVPPPLADLLRSLLAVAPWARPSADAARVALAGLAAEALSWPTSGGGAQTASPARWHQQEPGRSLTLVAFDVEGVDPLIGGTRDGAIE